ncbi:MAG: hypothetical protein LLG00_12345 [Planctomycetaceae bacterium]|nr:hypothetical protein [Planctomycetaceae bacterium]
MRSDDRGLSKRFAFPELSEPRDVTEREENAKKTKGPRTVWPECRPETAKACAELAEAIRWRLSGDRSSVVAITSPATADGKTSLVLGLARELAPRVPRGVLVVDADPLDAGLTARLRPTVEGAHELGEGGTTIWPTDIQGLSVLPIVRSEHVSLRWHSPSWIADLRDRWPLVLLDCPSLEHAETSLMLRECDGVYLVVRLGHTSRRAVVEASEVIHACGGRLLGCIAVA